MMIFAFLLAVGVAIEVHHRLTKPNLQQAEPRPDIGTMIQLEERK